MARISLSTTGTEAVTTSTTSTTPTTATTATTATKGRRRTSRRPFSFSLRQSCHVCGRSFQHQAGQLLDEFRGDVRGQAGDVLRRVVLHDVRADDRAVDGGQQAEHFANGESSGFAM